MTYKTYFKDFRHPVDVFGTLKPIFSMALLLGISPIRIAGPVGKRRVEVTTITVLYAVGTLCLFIGCFLIAIVHRESILKYFFNTEITQLGDTLQKISGLLGMTLIFASSITRRQSIVAVMKGLHKIDGKLSNVGVIINYSSAMLCAYASLALGVCTNAVFLTGSMYVIMSRGIYPSYTEFISFFSPHIILTVVVIMYFGFSIKIKERFMIANQILQNLQLSVATKHVSLARNSKISTGSMKCDSFSLCTIASKTAGEIIDDVMEIHSLLCDAASTANKYFTYQILTIVSISFLIIVFDSYYILETVLGITKRPSDNTTSSTGEFLAFFSCQTTLYILAVLAIVEGSSRAINESEKTASIVHKLINCTKDLDIREKLFCFSMQLIHEKVSFSAAGLFTIDRTLYFTISGATTTYLIILLQFSSGAVSTPVGNNTTPTLNGSIG